MLNFYKNLKDFLRPWKNPISHILLKVIKFWGAGRVISGPFKGLKMKQKFPTKPMLLGVWEKELSFIWETLNDMRNIIDVGAAEGFYAVGLAKKYPRKNIIAFEMNSKSRKTLEMIAKDNSVSNIKIYGKCEFENLAKLRKKLYGAIIIIDCEGYEIQLLEVKKLSIFEKTHILVEMHEMYQPGCTKILKTRFANTHHISEIKGQHRSICDWPNELKFIRPFFPRNDLLNFMDEGRPYPMNWLFMKPKSS